MVLFSISRLRNDCCRPLLQQLVFLQFQCQQSRGNHQGKLDYVVNPKSKDRKFDFNAKKQKKKRSRIHSFIDRARFRVQGGCGGRGSLSTMRLARKNYLKADGGHGGDGGSVIIIADPSTQSLERSHPHVMGGDGGHGEGQDCHGARGKNYLFRVPVGVIVKRIIEVDEEWDETSQTVRKISSIEENDENNYVDYNRDGMDDFDGQFDNASFENNEEEEEEDDIEESDQDDPEDSEEYGHHEDDGDDADNAYGVEDMSSLRFREGECESSGDDEHTMDDRKTVVIADLDVPGAHVVVARGGLGGKGTCTFASKFGPLPDANFLIRRSKPVLGEVAFLELELKLIADVGLVGFPNAGKSSLLRAMSRATPAVAPYPFTTIHPLVGMIEYRDGLRIRAADIPGLIDGASQGKGKGHDFLRHIERTKALLYMVDAAGVDFRNPVSDLEILAKELSSYGDGSLMERRALVVANKLDLLDDVQIPEILSSINDAAVSLGIQTEQTVLGISAGVTGEGLPELSRAIRNVVTKVEEDRQEELEQSAIWK
jgi:GTP-binding protein